MKMCNFIANKMRLLTTKFRRLYSSCYSGTVVNFGHEPSDYSLQESGRFLRNWKWLRWL